MVSPYLRDFGHFGLSLLLNPWSLCRKPEGSATESVLNSRYSGHTDRSVSLARIVLWCLGKCGSCVGGLARGAWNRPTGSGAGSISYYNYNLSTQLGMTMFQSGSIRVGPKIRALYSAALYGAVSSTQYVDKTNATYGDMIMRLGGEGATGIQAAMDFWNNIRIPKLESLFDHNSGDPHRWVATPWQESAQNYSSLIGDRIERVYQNFTGNTTFNTSSGYQNFDVREERALITHDITG
ncbi:hypothetical protein EJ02DRAFT_470979 [Clathrospora elynae]|uniref:Uncharacterized protein n=1 Tax=Clathrospora elynae TaxID=706981 RepID=A0A6A5SBB5_9PLEO|nr:hypothetical protein EJ02DRAFT_470979 [Clathrospora elynae]